MSEAQLNEICVGTKYQTTHGDGSNTPWLDGEDLQKRVEENQWIRWDGVEGTAEEHAQWALTEARSLMSDSSFRYYGEKKGCKYYIHDEKTQEQDGCGLFKIVGQLELEPKDLLAFVFDMPAVAEADSTVVLMKTLATYRGKKKGDAFNAAVYWANDPGWPFYIRDGIDLAGYHKDEDGTMWQVSTSLTGGDYFQSMPGGTCATDCIFAYKLKPNGDGTTEVTLINQNKLYGWIPVFLSNMMVCRVLIDYMKTIEEKVKERKESGEHQKMLKQLELNDA